MLIPLIDLVLLIVVIIVVVEDLVNLEKILHARRGTHVDRVYSMAAPANSAHFCKLVPVAVGANHLIVSLGAA